MIQFDKDDIKKKRILRAFINSVRKVIKEEGIENVTIRKIAKKAGYNSASIYNYFDNLNQLIFFGSISYLDDYVKAIPFYLNKSEDELDKYLLIWECFAKNSFENPNIFYAIFTENIGDNSENLFKKYYKLFPEELDNIPKRYIPMLLESELSKRCSIHISPCIEAGYFTTEVAEEVDERIRLIYHGMLSLMVNNRLEYNSTQATEIFMKYISSIIHDKTLTKS
ncbi:MAG TPA: TetR/AcrR family transcriptional regulator [Halanaerobiales bacterium]|nr:TetR/AcrR family transcriptional regulator [Halanaerobiales bacterium]